MNNDDLVEVMRLVPEGGDWRDLPPEIAERVMGGSYRSSGGRTSYFRRLNRDRPAPTIVGSPTQKSTLLWHPFEDRALSIEEAARLQSYPDQIEHGEPMNITALDIFAGHGWGVACQQLGITEYGVEIMPEAVATRALHGMETIYNDVWEGLADGHAVPEHDLLIASPPCQTFSMAGGGAGRKALDEVVGLIDSKAYQNVAQLRAFGEGHDPRTALVLTPLTHVYRDLPRYVVLEQVPPVLPVWERMAEEMRAWGYSVWTGVLNAEQYGVPQTRKRAVLMAKRDPELDGEATPPVPTHSRYYSRSPEKLDEGVLPWASMAEALGWTESREVASNYGTGGDPSARGRRGGDKPASAVTSKVDRNVVEFVSNDRQANSAKRSATEPAPTITGGHDSGNRVWRHGETGEQIKLDPAKPSPTVAGDPRIPERGFRKAGEPQMANATKVTLDEAAALQSYPQGFEFAGAKGKQFLQVGNAVPPLLARRVLEALLGV